MALTQVLDQSALDKRFALGDTAITKMLSEAAKVDAVITAALLSTSLGLAANPWSDEDFRNWADWIDNIGTTVGLGAATYLAINGDRDASGRVKQVGWSLMLSSASKLVSTVFGNQTGGKFESKVKFVEFTRRAYDNMRSVAIQLTGDVDRNAQFINEITDFQKEYRSAKTPEAQQAEIMKAVVYLIRYDDVLGTIQSMITRYTAVVESFCPGMMKAVADGTASTKSCAIQDETTGNTPMQLPPQAAADIRVAAKQLQALKKDEAIAQQSRVLTGELRNALTAGF